MGVVVNRVEISKEEAVVDQVVEEVENQVEVGLEEAEVLQMKEYYKLKRITILLY